LTKFKKNGFERKYIKENNHLDILQLRQILFPYFMIYFDNKKLPLPEFTNEYHKLFGEPEITTFKVNYKRHKFFSPESIEKTFKY
jgi:hypothetical protein